jgi:hypothetical protein
MSMRAITGGALLLAMLTVVLPAPAATGPGASVTAEAGTGQGGAQPPDDDGWCYKHCG